MFAAFLLTVSALWTAVVVDIIAESASSGATKISLFGRVLSEPSSAAGIVLLTALAASAAVALSSAIAYSRGRRLERQMAAELDERWEAISQRSAGSVARGELLEWRSADLQTTLNELLSKRDELLAEILDLRGRDAAFRKAAREQRESLVRSTKGSEGTPDLVVVPEIDLDAEHEVAPVDITTLVPTRPRRGSARQRAHDAGGAGGAGVQR